MSLTQAPQGESVTVVRVEADAKTRRHLENLGVMSGALLTPLSLTGGNVIIRVRDARIAIDRDVAESIIVRKSFAFA